MQRLIAILKGTGADWPFWSPFCPTGAQKEPESAIGVFFLKIGRLRGFKYKLVNQDPSQTESSLLLPKEPGLCAGLQTIKISTLLHFKGCYVEVEWKQKFGILTWSRFSKSPIFTVFKATPTSTFKLHS